MVPEGHQRPQQSSQPTASISTHTQLNEGHAYFVYTTHAHKSMPMLTVQIEGEKINFLVDSGATQSLIKETDLPNAPLSGKFLHSKGASGQTVKELLTFPLSVVHPFTSEKLHHPFLLSSCCPVNLLARDLILKLGLLIKCTPTGLAVSPQPEELAFPLLSELVYVFSWHVQGACLLTWAANRVPPTATFMTQQTLHCTTFVTMDPADPTGDQFLCSPVQWLHITHVCWSGQTCFLLVSLRVTQEPFYQVPDSYPHISLSKAPADKWQSLGPAALSVHTARDWIRHSENVFYSPSTGFFRETFLFLEVPGEPTKDVIDQTP